MTIRINNQAYPLDDSWMSALRYRARYGVSFLYEEPQSPEDRLLSLARLCYTAIIGGKPDEATFLWEALSDPFFAQTAEAFRARLYRSDASTEGLSGEASEERPDELHTVAVWAHYRLPECLLGELSVAQVAGLLRICNNLTNGKAAPRPMKDSEQAKIYGISEGLEKQIELHLTKEAARNGIG